MTFTYKNHTLNTNLLIIFKLAMFLLKIWQNIMLKVKHLTMIEKPVMNETGLSCYKTGMANSSK